MADVRRSALILLLIFSFSWTLRTKLNVPSTNCYACDQFYADGDGFATANFHACNLRMLPRRLILATRGYYRSNIPRCLWSSRGYTSLLVPGHDPPKDITVFMDVALNPGPSSSGNPVNAPSVLDEQHGDFDPVTVFNLPSKGLKIMHLNIRSIGNKLELIKILLLRRSIGILALTETWLDETWHDLELTVPGYNLFRKDRSSNIQARLRVGEDLYS